MIRLIILLSVVLLCGMQYAKLPNGNSCSRASPVPMRAQLIHSTSHFQHIVEIQFVLLLLLDVGQCTLTFVLSFLRKRPRRIIVGERWLIWDQWHDGQGVVVASCLEKTPTATVNIQCRTCRKDRHRLAYCCYNSSIRVGSNSSRHARNHYVPCYVPVVEC